jgi:hypothetical protein
MSGNPPVARVLTEAAPFYEHRASCERALMMSEYRKIGGVLRQPPVGETGMSDDMACGKTVDPY